MDPLDDHRIGERDAGRLRRQRTSSANIGADTAPVTMGVALAAMESGSALVDISIAGPSNAGANFPI